MKLVQESPIIYGEFTCAELCEHLIKVCNFQLLKKKKKPLTHSLVGN